MFDWLSSRLGFGQQADRRRALQQDVDQAIGIVMEETDPRLQLVSGYRRRLQKPLVRSLVYIDRLLGRIPGPFDINREAFGASIQVNALFGSVDDIAALTGQCRVLQAFFGEHPDCDEVYATLVMQRQDKQVFGMALDGDTVMRDVAQVAVNFSGHRIGVCAATEAELRDRLRWRGIHGLSIAALERITQLKVKSDALQQQRTLLKMKLRGLQSQHRGLDALALAEEAPADAVALVHELETTRQRLAAVNPPTDTLDEYLSQVRQVFNHPSKYLRVEPAPVCVDRMGIRCADGDSGAGGIVENARVTIANNPPVAGLIARFSRRDMPARP